VAHLPSKSADIEEIVLTRQQVEACAHEFGWDDLGEGCFLELAYYGPSVFCASGFIGPSSSGTPTSYAFALPRPLV